MRKIILIVAKYLFFLYAFLWNIIPKHANSMKDVLEIFYVDFLRIDVESIEIININEEELVTRCKNPCPIL